MDIKDLIQKIILEADEATPQLTRGQRDQLAALTRLWRQTIPELSDEQALVIYLEIRQILPKINPSQPAVANFLKRHDGRFNTQKYTIEDLKGISKIDFKSLLDFLHEFVNFKIELDGQEVEDDVTRLKRIFRTDGAKPTVEKIETSKGFWEGNENKVIDEGDLRVYEIKSKTEAQRYGYYYQEILRQKLIYNIENNKRPTSATPWCIEARGEQQIVNYNGRAIIGGIGNMYSSYRSSNYFYFVIDESRDALTSDETDVITSSPDVNYHISTIMGTPNGRFKICNLYNSPQEQWATWEQIVKIYPKIAPHKDVFVYKEYKPEVELDIEETTILDLINENENSQYDFSIQTRNDKQAFITAGRPLSQPRSWDSMVDDLKQEYINGFQSHNTLQRCSTFEFFKAIIKSENWKRKLDERLKAIGQSSGIIGMVSNFMKGEFILSTRGFKNPNTILYQSIKTKKYGIFSIKGCDFLQKDGIDYGPYFTKGNRIDIDDDENNRFFWAFEYTGDNGAKFYTLHDDDFIGEDRKKAYIMSEKKWNEISQNFQNDTTSVDLPQQTDIGEIKKGV